MISVREPTGTKNDIYTSTEEITDLYEKWSLGGFWADVLITIRKRGDGRRGRKCFLETGLQWSPLTNGGCFMGVSVGLVNLVQFVCY
jgi:hypothetical protein